MTIAAPSGRPRIPIKIGASGSTRTTSSTRNPRVRPYDERGSPTIVRWADGGRGAGADNGLMALEVQRVGERSGVAMMRAALAERPGGPEGWSFVRSRGPRPGWALVKVEACGLNRSEYCRDHKRSRAWLIRRRGASADPIGVGAPPRITARCLRSRLRDHDVAAGSGLLRHRRGHCLRAARQERAARPRRRGEGPVREGAAAQGLFPQRSGTGISRRVLADVELPHRTHRTAPP